MSDFQPALHAVPYEQLPSVDKYTLGRLSAMVQEIQSAYQEHQFNRVNQALLQFAITDLSAFYLDNSKDRLYISSENDFRRRSCQTVISTVLEQLSVAMAPIVPHMSEEVWRSIPYSTATQSVFQRGWMRPGEMFPACDEEQWNRVKTLRRDVNQCIEAARRAKDVGASMESKVYLYVRDKNEEARLRRMLIGDAFGRAADAGNSPAEQVDDLRFMLMVSQIEIVSSLEALQRACPAHQLLPEASESGVAIGVTRADGKKCDRCWYYSPNVGQDHVHSDLCLRCADVVKADKHVFVDSVVV
jgi:isoleucyl-tRNA synthetase